MDKVPRLAQALRVDEAWLLGFQGEPADIHAKLDRLQECLDRISARLDRIERRLAADA